jgi:hypothetical protein
MYLPNGDNPRQEEYSGPQLRQGEYLVLYLASLQAVAHVKASGIEATSEDTMGLRHFKGVANKSDKSLPRMVIPIFSEAFNNSNFW